MMEDLNVHQLVGREYPTIKDACEVSIKISENPPKVDTRLLLEMVNEAGEYGFGEIICMLEMDEIPMTDAVRKLGICAGVLFA